MTKNLQRMAAIQTWDSGVTIDMLSNAGAQLLFASAVDIDGWSSRLRQQTTRFDWWQCVAEDTATAWPFAREQASAPAVALALSRKGSIQPLTDKLTIKPGDDVAVLWQATGSKNVEAQLHNYGWKISTNKSLPRPLKSQTPPTSGGIATTTQTPKSVPITN